MSPTGGDKDTDPPLIDSSRTSFQNGATNFKDQRIQVSFNEWVTLRDLSKNLLISPPIEPKPEIKIIGKRLVVDFKDIALLTNTTYSIYLGDAVKDITEGNAVPNMNLVFSTGPFIDTLSLTGQVKSASDQSAAQNISVCLYNEGPLDSILPQNPQYLTKSNEGGSFYFNYLKEGVYKLIAFEDKNFNFKYDSINEPVAFLSEPILINSPQALKDNLQLFEPDKPIKITSRELAPGQYTIGLTKTPKKIKLLNPLNGDIAHQINKNQIKFYYTCPPSNSSVLFNIDGQIIDTLKRRPCETNDISVSNEFARDEISVVIGDTAIVPTTIPTITSKLIMSELIYQDSILIKRSEYSLVSESNKIKVNHKFKPGKYNLILRPNSVTDIWGRPNLDTLSCIIQARQKEGFGKFIFRSDSIAPYQSIGVLIYKGQQTEMIYGLSLTPEMSPTTIKNVGVGSYRIKYFDDANNNGIWDSGDLFKNLQPEKILKIDTREIRANWDLELSPDF